MAETITQRTELPEFLEAEAKLYLGELQPAIAGQKAADLSQVYGSQFVAGLDPLQQEAIKQAEAGIGAYQPYIQAAQAATGPGAYQAYMSPYQQDVISSTLKEFDIQAQKGLPAIGQAAYQAGAFGGARQGVAEAEYRAASDRNRAALQAQLLQQGFGQAQQAAQTQFGQQMQLAGQVPSLIGQQVAGLTTLGAGLQAQRQAELSAQQQLKQQQLVQPLTAAQTYGQGIMGLISGYPTTTTTTQPSPSPLQSALGLGATLAGVYRALR
jgi:hypothetical protein